ncbi:MAG: hypothetical protein QOE07_862, partial [Acidimicrobiaceae bacterium]|nr:hypothetical protein [Acidimicrobiaceae bacterium]
MDLLPGWSKVESLRRILYGRVVGSLN